jgi:pyruvate decarboxylase
MAVGKKLELENNTLREREKEREKRFLQSATLSLKIGLFLFLGFVQKQQQQQQLLRRQESVDLCKVLEEKESVGVGVLLRRKMGSTTKEVQQQPLHPAKAWTLGRYIGRRLAEIGVNDVFSVPGDFNLLLLDELLADPEIQLRGCCNELNAGYAADGYARCRGVGACVVTFTVGGLSVINAIAGAYSENLPVICLVGGPNSNDYGTNHILHHTLGLPDFSQEYRCFKEVTCAQV